MAISLSSMVWSCLDNPDAPMMTTTEALAPTTSAQTTQSPNNPTPVPRKYGPADVVDVKEWLEHGPKKPLVPPEIKVEATPAPGSIMTAEPLTPPEIHVEVEAAPGSSASPNPDTSRNTCRASRAVIAETSI